jgi:uncharacterized Tic20 family protein
LIGTTAQYIKTAPLLRLMQVTGAMLIDLGAVVALMVWLLGPLVTWLIVRRMDE